MSIKKGGRTFEGDSWSRILVTGFELVRINIISRGDDKTIGRNREEGRVLCGPRIRERTSNKGVGLPSCIIESVVLDEKVRRPQGTSTREAERGPGM